MNDIDLRRNGSGYYDPTAYAAIKNIETKEEEDFHRLLGTIFYICELAGFHIENRIVLKDLRSGRVWK